MYAIVYLPQLNKSGNAVTSFKLVFTTEKVLLLYIFTIHLSLCGTIHNITTHLLEICYS